MKVVLDIEANALVNPTRIWVVVCKDIETQIHHIFREEDRERFNLWAADVKLWIGHNILGYDFCVLARLWGFPTPSVDNVVDTLILSRLLDYSRQGGHSLEAYGKREGLEKIRFYDFSKYSVEMEEYCVRDTDVCENIYRSLGNTDTYPGLKLEQEFQLLLNEVHATGFAFDTVPAGLLLDKVKGELNVLDSQMEAAFPARPRPVREVHPKLTKYGTLNRSDFRFVKDGDLSEYNGGPFTRIIYEPFNASSHKQIVDVLNKAGWSPVDRTQTHIDTVREIEKNKRIKRDDKDLEDKLVGLLKYGWKVNENNLTTLPPAAPAPARMLSKRIILESRRRTLVEWLGLVDDNTQRVHGKFVGIGAWTHRMAHQEPNLANIPNEYKEDGTAKLLGKEMRSLWIAPPGKVLLGVDAEGIQLRVFAHYVNDPELTRSLVNGRKQDKTDPHSLNQRVLGKICKTRQAAKRFLYSLLLGGGIGKFSEILECTKAEAEDAVNKFNERFPGFSHLKRYVIPSDARRGFFKGIDGRDVRIPGDDYDSRRHLCMSGYLQCGEAILIKRAATIFSGRLRDNGCRLVDIIHDEYQIECPSRDVALEMAPVVANGITEAGEIYKLNVPMAGSYWNEDKKDYTIGQNWYLTH